MYNLHYRMTSGSIVGLLLIIQIVAGGFNITSLENTCASSGILCFGLKGEDPTLDACVSEKSCDLQVAITKNKEYEGKVRFQLMGKPAQDNQAVSPDHAHSGGIYVSVGLSYNSGMGDDSVVECVHSKKTEGKVYTSWNVGNAKKNERSDDKSYISEDWVSYKDGILYCEFYRDANTTVNGHLFDLNSDYSKQKYHVLLAMGNTQAGEGDVLDYHTRTQRRGSQEAILYKDAIKYSGAHVPYVQVSTTGLCALIIVYSGMF